MLAVIFDIDGTILDTEHINEETLRIALRNMHPEIILDREMYKKTIGRNGRARQKMLIDKWPQITPEEYEQIREKRRARFLEIAKDGIPLKPGVLEIFEFLNKNNIPFGFYTSALRITTIENLQNVNHNGEKISLLPYINSNYITAGDEVTKGKPDPEGYISTAKKMGITDMQQVVGFEDSKIGVEALLNAEITPVWIPDMIKPTGKVTAKLYDTLLDAIPYMEKMVERFK